MPRTKDQNEALRAKKIELIEDVAMKCFAQNGFHNTSISLIAKEAGISTGLTYNYFSSKDELLKSIYLKGIKRVFEPIKDRSELGKADFTNFIEHIFNEIEANTQFWRLYFIVISQPDVLATYHEYMMETVMQGMGLVTAYFAKQGATNPMVETRMLFSILDGICINYLIDSKAYPLAAIKEKFLNNYE